MKQIVIVEDDINLSRGLVLALKSDAVQLVQCHDVKAAKAQLACGMTSLVLLDINLPDGSGFEILELIKRNEPHIPVILLSANDMDADIINGLEKGADDYITKPFNLDILRARVNTQLNRLQTKSAHALEIEDYRFDFERMQFSKGPIQIELSKIEQRLLRALVENRGLTLRRDLLVERVWQTEGNWIEESTLSVTVKRLRDKLDAADYIKTVYGIGYTWVTKI
ncbi:MAG: DNA-binding response regulator [Clostridiales bacterium 38-18]|mgnify:FL=1|nr:MAG: DNA-binding response regulator [Clostridiales bacterium 38-18]